MVSANTLIQGIGKTGSHRNWKFCLRLIPLYSLHGSWYGPCVRHESFTFDVTHRPLSYDPQSSGPRSGRGGDGPTRYDPFSES